MWKSKCVHNGTRPVFVQCVALLIHMCDVTHSRAHAHGQMLSVRHSRCVCCRVCCAVCCRVCGTMCCIVYVRCRVYVCCTVSCIHLLLCVSVCCHVLPCAAMYSNMLHMWARRLSVIVQQRCSTHVCDTCRSHTCGVTFSLV